MADEEICIELGLAKALPTASTTSMSTSTLISSTTHNWTYDGEGRLWKVPGNNGQLMTINYDLNGNALNEIDALGHLTSHTYDALNNCVATATDAANGVTTIGDHPAGRVNKEVYPSVRLPELSVRRLRANAGDQSGYRH